MDNLSFYKYYSQHSGEKEYYQNATKYLLKDMLVNPKFNDEKLEHELSNNMEKNQPQCFVPTMIYSFLYASPDESTVGSIRFKDRMPLIFVTEFNPDNNMVLGLNFNLMPGMFRAVILDRIYQTNPNFYDSMEGIDEFTLNHNAVVGVGDKSNIMNFVHYLNYGKKNNPAFRTYNLKYCKYLRLIEYDMWKYIPFLNAGPSIKDADIGDIYKQYINWIGKK